VKAARSPGVDQSCFGARNPPVKDNASSEEASHGAGRTWEIWLGEHGGGMMGSNRVGLLWVRCRHDLPVGNEWN
jgi:hypothetical protein